MLKKIIIAIITQNHIFSSGNAQTIRDYLRITAFSADASRLAAMSDSQVLSYAANVIAGTADATADTLSSPLVIWQQEGTTIYLAIPVTNGDVTRTASKVNGVWY